MNVPLWADDLARAFWREVGAEEPFPRELRRPIARVLPLTVVSLPRLRVALVRDWLRDNGAACPCDEADRPLWACLFAQRGEAFVFLDGTDASDEQRFSLAHELGHFLRDYWQPRRLAGARVGEQVLEVFDAERPPTPGERLDALLARVPLGVHLHLMRRDAHGGFAGAAVAEAERGADRLAYELLAPAAAVSARFGGGSDRAALARLLRAEFGLPAAQAEDYAALLLPPAPADPLLRRLGLAGA
jgi:hypothetical protein